MYMKELMAILADIVKLLGGYELLWFHLIQF